MAEESSIDADSPSNNNLKGVGQTAATSLKLQDDIAALVNEARALLKYVARRGELLENVDNGIAAYDELTEAIAAAIETATDASWNRLMKAYRAVSAVTHAAKAVNGKTVEDTLRSDLIQKRNRPLWIGVLLFVAALLLEMYAVKLGVTSIAEDVVWHAISLSLVQFLIPACWGGLGACVYLIKRLSDLLADFAFDENQLRGDTTRIFLGAMIGAIVVVIFFPEFGERIAVGNVSFGPATAAFLSGLGTRVVYGAFETSVEGLANRILGAGS